ncbi:zinc finger protein [Macleaya cordata]|uniref:Zinc finger protein n=1 Tax=Macleaya cordata TaxID=56857 RepID=A0A200PZ57_MACCD|nr:zinc finger protein [Macleaya cordata]
MDETALKARRRLEEKLRGLAPSRGSSKPQTTNNSNSTNERRSSKPAKEAEKGGNDAEKVVLVGRRFTQLERMNSQREVCSICLEEFGTQQQVMNLPCFHRYHSDCLLPWLNTHSHCPYCRTHVQS